MYWQATGASSVSDVCVNRMILAFDTSGSIGSVAIAQKGQVLARADLFQQVGHASCLLPTIATVLNEAGASREQLTDLVIGEGPGSFTGVRVAAATAKGLSRGLNLPLWAVSSLAAAAMSIEDGAVRYALFDARAERVYGACYGVDGTRIQTLIPPHGGELCDVISGDVPNGTVFVGDASQKHREIIEERGFSVGDPGSGTSLADGLIRYWTAQPEGFRPVTDAVGWEPQYIRPSSAERLWG